MLTETMLEVEIRLTEEQVEKIREATGMAVGRLKIKAAEGDSGEGTRPQALLDCVVESF